MAATVEGTFILIDRASSTMRKMERQAASTMAAIEALGAAQDKHARSSATAERHTDANTGSLRRHEQQARRTSGAVEGLGRSHQSSAGRVGVLQRALSALRGEFDRLGASQQRGGQASGLKNLEQGLKTAEKAMGNFGEALGVIGSAVNLFKFPALISGVTLLVQAVTALGGGAYAAVSGLAALGSAVLALPAAVSVAAQAVFTLKAAFSGVAKAAGLGIQAQQQWGANQAQWQQQVVQAQQSVADAVHGVREAMWSQGEAAHTLSEAYYAHSQAVQGLTQALYDQQQAQIDLTIARKDAIRTLQDMEFEAHTAILKEARAGLSLRQAQVELQQALVTPGTSQLTIESDRLAVMEAQASAAQTHTQAVRSRVDYAQAAGGSPSAGPVRQVAQAQHALMQSHLGVANAQHALQQSAYGIVQAQHGVAEAAYAVRRAEVSVAMAQQQLNLLMRHGNAGVWAYRQALAALTPTQRRMAQLLVAMHGPWRRLQEVSAQGVFPGFARSVLMLRGALPRLTGEFRATGGALGSMMANVTRAFFGPHSLGQTRQIMRSNVVVLQEAAKGSGYFADMMRRLMVAAGPTLQWAARMVTEWLRMRDAFYASAAGQAQLRDRFAKLRTELTLLWRLLSQVWRFFHNLNAAAWDLHVALMDGATRGMKHFADSIAPGTKGAQKLHDWFIGLLPVLRALGRFLKAVGGALYDLTKPSNSRNTAALVDGLTALVSPIGRIALMVEKAFGPQIEQFLQAFAGILETLASNSGPLVLILRFLTLIAKALNWILKLPGVGPGVAAVLGGGIALVFLAKFTAKITGAAFELRKLSRMWAVFRNTGGGSMPSPGVGGEKPGAVKRLFGAAGTDLSWGIRSMGGPGSEANPLVVVVMNGGLGGLPGGRGGGAVPGVLNGPMTKAEAAAADEAAAASRLGRAGRLGASLSRIPLLGRAVPLLSRLPGLGGLAAGADAVKAGAAGAGLLGGAGALGIAGKALGGLGRVLGPIGLALTAMQGIQAFLGTHGNFGERMQSVASSLTLGIIHPGVTRQHQRELASQRTANAFAHYRVDPMTGQTDIGQFNRRQAQLQREIYQTQHPGRNPDVTAGGGMLPVDKKKLLERMDELAKMQKAFWQTSWAAGTQASSLWTQGFEQALSRGKNPKRAMGQMITGLTLQMKNLGPGGKRALQNNVVAWGAQIAASDPAMRRPVAALNKWIVAQFKAQGRDISIVNGQILDGSTQEWNQIGTAITNPAAVALAKLTGTFGQMKAQALGSLQAMGYTPGQAQSLFKAVQSGLVKPGDLSSSSSRAASGLSPSHLTSVGNRNNQGQRASGGRVGGRNMHDVYQYGQNVLGGGELVMNRWHEMDANTRLMRHGEPTVGAIVAGRNTPHWAFASGGRAAGGKAQVGGGGGKSVAASYQFPFSGGGWGWSRTDQGVDFYGNASVGAIGSGRVTYSNPSDGWYSAAPAFMVYSLNSGPRAGSYVYVAEHLANMASAGTNVNPGQAIAQMTGGIEMGWAAGPQGHQMIQPHGGDHLTAAGLDFKAFVSALTHGVVTGGTGGAGSSAGSGAPPPMMKPLKPPKIGVGGIPGVVAQLGANAIAAAMTAKINDQISKTGGAGGGSGGFSGKLSGPVQNQVFQFMTQNGFNKVAIAGMLGNAMQESSMNPNAPGGGLWQQISNFGSGTGGSLLNQMQRMLPQIQGLKGQLNAARSPGEAATIFEQGFERAGIPAMGNRISAANAAFAAGYAGGGRLRWGGWNRAGGEFVTRGPTLFGAGEGGQRERVRIDPVHHNATGGGDRSVQIHIEKIEVHRRGDIKKIVDEEFGLLADHLGRQQG